MVERVQTLTAGMAERMDSFEDLQYRFSEVADRFPGRIEIDMGFYEGWEYLSEMRLVCEFLEKAEDVWGKHVKNGGKLRFILHKDNGEDRAFGQTIVLGVKGRMDSAMGLGSSFLLQEEELAKLGPEGVMSWVRKRLEKGEF
jgi:hypothetical protein